MQGEDLNFGQNLVLEVRIIFLVKEGLYKVLNHGMTTPLSMSTLFYAK